MKIRKRGIAVLAAFALALTLASPISALAAQSVKGTVLYSDVTAYINGQQIPYYALDTQWAYIALTDLTNYGFEILTNPQARTASLSFNSSKLPTAIPAVEQVGKIGERAYSYWSTDWKVYINGKDSKHQVYNIAGRLSVDMRELDVFGNSVWDGAARQVRLTTKASSPAPAQPSQPSATTFYVTGYVYNASGSPVNNATVKLYGAGSAAKTYTTGANGAYTITGVPNGSVVYLEASATGATTVKSASFTVNGNVTGKDLRFAGGVTVSGVVRLANGTLIPNATLKLTNSSGTVVNTVTSGSNGVYTFTNVSPGNYTIQVSATGYASQVVSSFGILSTSLTRDVTLNPAAATITGTVIIPSGTYVQPSSVFVRVIDDSGAQYSDSVYVSFPTDYDTNNSSTQFTLSINKSFNGTKNFRVAVQYQYRLSSESSYGRTGTASSTSISIPSSSMQQYNAGQISLAAGTAATYSVSGYITGLAATERARVYIEPTNNTSSTYRNSYVTDWGYGGVQYNTYSFTNVPNGTYRIYAVIEGTSATIATISTLTVNGASVTNANLSANLGYSVTINVFLARDLANDVQTVRIQLVDATTNNAYGDEVSASYYPSSHQAYATFANVPMGMYKVVLRGLSSGGTVLEHQTLSPTQFSISAAGSYDVTLY